MEQVVRAVGVLNLIAGAMLVVVPGTAREIMRARAEFAQLSDTALRVLGSWIFLTGALTMLLTLRPEMVGRMREVVAGEARRAA